MRKNSANNLTSSLRFFNIGCVLWAARLRSSLALSSSTKPRVVIVWHLYFSILSVDINDVDYKYKYVISSIFKNALHIDGNK